MDLKPRIEKVIAFIGKNLDEKLNLDQLSQVASFSQYHFHRLFTAYTGLSLQQYVRWLRLKRAAHQLIIEKDKTIIAIAIHAGFESHEAFTRAFKQASGQSPKDFRTNPNWHLWEKSPFNLPKPGEMMINVEIKTMPSRRIAVVEHRGSPQTLGDSIKQLMNWTTSKAITLKAGDAFGIAYDDPELTNPSLFRFDLGVRVPDSMQLEGAVVEKRLPAGRYAVVMHKGSRENISETVHALYRDWLPQSQEEPGHFPCVFCYHNFDHEVAQTDYLTECWLLLGE